MSLNRIANHTTTDYRHQQHNTQITQTKTTSSTTRMTSTTTRRKRRIGNQTLNLLPPQQQPLLSTLATTTATTTTQMPRLSDGFCTRKEPKVRSRRRRRRLTLTATATDANNVAFTNNIAPALMHSHRLHQHQQQKQMQTATTTIEPSTVIGNSFTLFSLLQRVTQTLTATTTSKSLATPNSAAYITALLLLLSTTCSLCSASPCNTNSWWDPVKDKCIPCTVCQGEMIPLRPCQLHRDTICGSIYDLKIDWVVLAKTEPNWKERRKSDDVDYNLEQFQQQHHLQHLTHEQLQQLHDETLPLDWQTAALFLAVLACLLFFIVAACILIHHMRQWRRMERRLDQDVEELSTKLMAKLAEVQSLEGGTFFIGNADALRLPTTTTTITGGTTGTGTGTGTTTTTTTGATTIPTTATTFQPQHVLLPDKPAKHHHHPYQHNHHHHHHHDRRILKTLQPGNVYIEENGSKG